MKQETVERVARGRDKVHVVTMEAKQSEGKEQGVVSAQKLALLDEDNADTKIDLGRKW